mgnify:CR=1 FL=1
MANPRIQYPIKLKSSSPPATSLLDSAFTDVESECSVKIKNNIMIFFRILSPRVEYSWPNSYSRLFDVLKN